MSNQVARVMSFSDIVQGRDASVRVTDDGLVYAVDLVIVMTGKDKNHASEVSHALYFHIL